MSELVRLYSHVSSRYWSSSPSCSGMHCSLQSECGIAYSDHLSSISFLLCFCLHNSCLLRAWKTSPFFSSAGRSLRFQTSPAGRTKRTGWSWRDACHLSPRASSSPKAVFSSPQHTRNWNISNSSRQVHATSVKCTVTMQWQQGPYTRSGEDSFYLSSLPAPES